MSSLGEEYPKEQARCRELLALYKEIPTGAFGAMAIEQALRGADEAAASQDIQAMLRAFERMKGCQ